MTHRSKPRGVPFPSKEALLDYIRDNPGEVGKRDILRAFQLGPEHRQALKALLRELAEDGLLQKGRGRRFSRPGSLPEVMVVEISGTDTDGEVLARPLTWTEREAPPRIYMAPVGRGRPGLGIGDRLLAKLRRLDDRTYEGRTIRVIEAGPAEVLGVVALVEGEVRLRPTDRRHRSEFVVPPTDTLGAEAGELVRAELLPARKLGLRAARIVERLGDIRSPKSFSLIAIHSQDIPVGFPPAALKQAEACGPAPLGGRDDLRAVPLITIDGEDARDFDDAVWAEPDGEGWHLLVAIADVAWYVRQGDALDRAAYERGNSVYFPDRVVPMLPEALSNGWCSLKPNEDRPCLVAEMWIDAEGKLLRHVFRRALMKSLARLTYTQVQDAVDGRPDDTTGPLVEPVLTPLYGAYRALLAAREARGVLELDLPERKVVLGSDGHILAIERRPRFDSHRLIEEFMITANVAAAEAIERAHLPCMYRVHDQPSLAKLESLREFLDSLNLKLAKGQVLRPRHFNQILAKVKDAPHAQLVNEVILRSQAQAAYSPDNLGHFGLALPHYAHFTSPIRRYADLMVHRALIRGLRLGEGELADPLPDFIEAGAHISTTERRAQTAERDAVDRYTAAFLCDRVGGHFHGRVTGVSRFGLFVTLEPSGGDGLVPVRSLPDDYYIHDETRHCLVGRRNGKRYTLGDSVEVRLAEASPVTGGLILHLLDGGRESRAKAPHRGRPATGKPHRRGR